VSLSRTQCSGVTPEQPARPRWSLPGGAVEGGESEEQAVIREAAEETGVVVRVRNPENVGGGRAAA
jgi:ADP-ribose pyrophosphatase YjhB (NUDIX family)